MLYIRSGSRKKWNEWVEHIENEGKGTSNAIMDLIEDDLQSKKHSNESEKQIKESETIQREPENLETR